MAEALVATRDSLAQNGPAKPAAPPAGVARPQTQNPKEVPPETGIGSKSEALEALKRLRPAQGLQVDLFASEPLLENPVSFAFDGRGRVLVVETHRRRTSVYDIRNHADWLDIDFSFRTVSDRLNFFKSVLTPENKKLPPLIVKDQNKDGKFDYHDLEVESEHIRLLEDLNGDDKADRGTVFADGFNTAVSGVAAGVLAYKDNVYFTCIPDLWLLQDQNHDGKADVKKSLLTGFGVHISFGGHDLHGLRMGPDGKLYFSVADRGMDVTTPDGHFSNPDSGAVMRCNLDGSEFEVFATGLRNPQELAFDQYGNLWTGDNNGDGGDKARWVYVVEGGDSGWHIGWQHLPKMGAWNAEKLWQLAPTNTAAYLIPPVGHIGHGPAGLAFYPGTGLPPSYLNHFFLCDFPGGINSFAVRPEGAGFALYDEKPFLSEIYAVDIDFGPRGGAYVLDWVEGWDKTGKGRLWRVFDPLVLQEPIVQETKILLTGGLERASVKDLASNLAHPDMRVRLNSQYLLAEQGFAATNALVFVAQKSQSELARLHAIWALGQIGRTNIDVLAQLVPLLSDPLNPEIRAQAAKVLGEDKYSPALPELIKLLKDPQPRVRYFATMSLGKLRAVEAMADILAMADENANRDPYLRHAAVMAMTWINNEEVHQAIESTSPGVRMATLLAMRRLGRPEVATFLYDTDTNVVLEAARAIYDVPISASLSQLGSLIGKGPYPEPVMRRVLHANFRVGKFENALALAEYAGRNDAPETLRTLALELLGLWGKPPKRDTFLGLWRPLPPREGRSASLALRTDLQRFLSSQSESLQVAAIKAAVNLEITEAGGTLLELLRTKTAPPSTRLAALTALSDLKDPKLQEAVKIAGKDEDENVRREAARYAILTRPGNMASTILTTLEKGTVKEKQDAFQALAKLPRLTGEPIFTMWLDRLLNGKVDKRIQLDLLLAAEQREEASIKGFLQKYVDTRSRDDALSFYRETLYGGDAQAGKKIFFERQDAACLRCHKVNGEGGEVGPELKGIGARQTREYLLESLLLPNRQISKGFESAVVAMKDGRSVTGIVKSETDQELTLLAGEDGLVKLQKKEIASRTPGVSPMPADYAAILSMSDIRNLVEFLTSLQ